MSGERVGACVAIANGLLAVVLGAAYAGAAGQAELSDQAGWLVVALAALLLAGGVDALFLLWTRRVLRQRWQAFAKALPPDPLDATVELPSPVGPVPA